MEYYKTSELHEPCVTQSKQNSLSFKVQREELWPITESYSKLHYHGSSEKTLVLNGGVYFIKERDTSCWYKSGTNGLLHSL